ncbi:MAG: DUF2182 domain-containing protein [Proteobacteria bacterium]|nr:DUF2182 domain-containing protein [Pseudomonadota bacterium]
MITEPPSLSRLFREERFYVLAGLFALVGFSWIYLFLWKMPASGEIFTLPNYLTMFAMWAIMMVAMMVPSALPMILIYSHSVKKAKRDGGSLAPLSVFVLGYVIIWALFSALAAFLQLVLQNLGMVNKMMVGTNSWMMGGLLIIAGLYQMSPLKDTCLRFCQHPVMFITKHWRTGTGGALRMGVLHGGYCVGCCWALMILLFVGGVMNLLWVAAIAIYVLLEKMAPLPKRWPRISGAVLIAGGLVTGLQIF